ncbi:MAG TPA: GNAT family N-acetyltransferase [Puia sp.]|nr:GNAT family N-acetyltransferase [Puia sp.]
MNTAQFDVRLAEMDDAHVIAELSTQWGYQSTHEKIKYLLNGILQNKDHAIFVLSHDNQIIGWIHGIYSLRVESDPFVEIGGLVVDEDFRRHGSGKFLIKKMIEWSLARNCHLVRVRCNIIRREANAFYSAIGFNEIKQQKVYDMKI